MTFAAKRLAGNGFRVFFIFANLIFGFWRAVRFLPANFLYLDFLYLDLGQNSSSVQSSSVSKFYKKCKSPRYRRSGGRLDLSEHVEKFKFCALSI